MKRLQFFTVLLLLFSLSVDSSADDARLEARRRAKEVAVQSAGMDRTMSKEMPAAIQALPVFGEIEWTVNSLPFVKAGPHAGISGAGMVVVDGQIYLAGGLIPAGDETDSPSRRTSRGAYRYDPKSSEWTQNVQLDTPSLGGLAFHLQI